MNDEGENLTAFFDRDLTQSLSILGLVRPETPGPAWAAFEEFDRRLTRHLEWEERFLFPVAASKRPDLGPAAAALKEEHDKIRTLVAETKYALRSGDERGAAKRVVEIGRAMRAHAANEGRELMQPLESLVPPEEASALIDRLPRY